MKEHPSLPMRGAPNGIVRSMKGVEKSSGSSYYSINFKVYASPSSDTSSMLDSAQWGMYIAEVNNDTDYDWVRTLVDHSATVTSSDHSMPSAPGDLLLDTTLSLNEDINTTYIFSGSFGENFSTGIGLGAAPIGSSMTAFTQASNWAEFESSTDTDITVDTSITLGSGHPSPHQGLMDIPDPAAFLPLHNGETIWMFLDIM